MAEDTPSDRWPAYRFHATLPMVLVQNEEEEQALPAGYRDRPFSAEETQAAQQTSEDGGPTPRSRR